MPRVSKRVIIGGFNTAGFPVESVTLGGGLPPVIQTMWKERLAFSDLEGKAGEALAARIDGLKQMGCRLLRFAVPDLAAAEILGKLASMVSMPLVADIHFDYKIALRCLEFPIAKIRINPGNIGPYGESSTRKKIEAVLSGAAAKNVPIRIGLNAGSLPPDLRKEVDSGRADAAGALVRAAERELAIFREFDFKDVLVSMKASDIAETVKANRLLAERTDVPLHIGVTEAGPLIAGVARNTAALLDLLRNGIGDTVRVSLSDTMESEVIAAREIIAAAGDMAGSGAAKARGVRIVSCPLCGRNSFDTHAFTARWQNRFYALDKNITVAVMGCAVNGPGEARHADIGITGAGDSVVIFRLGKPVRTVRAGENADRIFWEEIGKL